MKKVIGEVIHGEKLGRKLGFPTANIAYRKNDIENAVFHLNIIIDGEIFSWMGSYMKTKWVFEAHIFNFAKDIYGKTIELLLLKKVRKNRAFTNFSELQQQIQQDQKIIQKQQLNILTFGSFDLVHQWHTYYLSQARKYGNHLITIVATDNNIKKIKWHSPTHKVDERIDAIKSLYISDEVLAWSEISPLQCIEKYQPHVICLGYDQRWKFVEALPRKLQELELDTQVIYIGSLKPEIYKSSLLKK